MSKKPTQGQKIDEILTLVRELATRPDTSGMNGELLNLLYGAVARYGVKVPGGQILMVAQIPYLQVPDNQGLTFEQQQDGTVMVSIVQESPAEGQAEASEPAEAGEETPGVEEETSVTPEASPTPALAEFDDDPEVGVDMSPGVD